MTGIQLQGCLFEGGQLTVSKPTSPSVVTVPKCTIGWVSSDTPPVYPEEMCITLPLYTSSTRERLVIQLSVPCGGAGNVSVMIQSGTALFLKEL